MSYDYIKRMYGVHPVPGRMARHTETGELVKILRERPSHAHYVRIKLPNGAAGFSHPTALDYTPSPPAEQGGE